MDFNEKGFLGTQVSEFRASVEAHYPDFFKACYHVNELAHTIKFKLKVHNHDGQEVLAATVFLRVLNGFQATTLLARVGLITDARVVLRSTLESLFVLKLLCEEESFFREYIGSDQVLRLKWMNVASQSKSRLFDELRSYATPKVRQELEEQIKKNKWKELKPIEVAGRAGLQEMYDTDYRPLSEEVHALPRSMDYLLGTDEAGEVRDFNWGPTDKGIDYLLFTAIRVLFIALVSVTKLFEVESNNELMGVEKTLTDLGSLLRA
jgi:hypothetical protein